MSPATLTVVYRDLSATQIPPITAEWVGAVYTPEAVRTPEQNEQLSLSDSLLAELEQADGHAPVATSVSECVLDVRSDFLAKLRVPEILQFNCHCHSTAFYLAESARLWRKAVKASCDEPSRYHRDHRV